MRRTFKISIEREETPKSWMEGVRSRLPFPFSLTPKTAHGVSLLSKWDQRERERERVYTDRNREDDRDEQSISRFPLSFSTFFFAFPSISGRGVNGKTSDCRFCSSELQLVENRFSIFSSPFFLFYYYGRLFFFLIFYSYFSYFFPVAICEPDRISVLPELHVHPKLG